MVAPERPGNPTNRVTVPSPPTSNRVAPPRLSLYGVPAGLLTLVKEAARHLLRRPVVGIAPPRTPTTAAGSSSAAADTGTWALPGGTLEWGETLRAGLARELDEEAGVTTRRLERVVGVYSRPDRDPRFHAVTIVVTRARRAADAPADEPARDPRGAALPRGRAARPRSRWGWTTSRRRPPRRPTELE